MRALGPVALAASCLLSASPALCRSAIHGGGFLALTQDDVYRGISQTCGHPAAQTDLHLRERGSENGAAFAGVWGSVGLGGGSCGSAKELEAYAGYGLALTANVGATLTYTRYMFPGGGYGNPHLLGQRHDYDQLGMSWSVAGRLYLTLAWTPDALGYERYEGSLQPEQGRDAVAYGAEWRQPLASWLSLAASAGYDRMTDPFATGYGFWSLGFSHETGPFELDLAYFHTTGRAVRLFGRDSAGGRLSATLLWRF
jgi:uncharacterized protein (TIGR02001 family)